MEKNPAIGNTFQCFLMAVPNPDKWGGLQQEGHPAQTYFAKSPKMRYDDESTPGRSTLGSPMTASSAAQQGTCENYATSGLSENKIRKREGR